MKAVQPWDTEAVNLTDKEARYFVAAYETHDIISAYQRLDDALSAIELYELLDIQEDNWQTGFYCIVNKNKELLYYEGFYYNELDNLNNF